MSTEYSAANASFVDNTGATQQIKLGKEIYAKAVESGMQVRDYINATYQTNEDKFGSTFDQLAAQANVFFTNDFGRGIKKATVAQMMDDRQAAGIVREGFPLSKLIFPAVVLAAVEDKLINRHEGDLQHFEKMIAVKDTISNSLFTRPVFNFDKVRDGNRSQPISQLTKPIMMGTLTVSETARKINTHSIGMMISDDAKQAATIDLFALSFTRLIESETLEAMDGYLNKLLTGDVDMGQGTLAAQTVTASSLDPASTTAANFTHKAYVKWLRKNNRKCHIDYVICDTDAYLTVTGRVGRPTVLTAEEFSNISLNPNRMVVNARMGEPHFFITEPGVLPANTLIGLDSRYALHRVTNLSANYEATERLLMQKGEQFRIDSGEIVYRLFDDAFSVLTF